MSVIATNPNEEAYLALLRDVRKHGRRVPTRAKLLSTGEPVDALSVFGRQVRYDLRAGFPLMTTKWVNFDAVAHELVWFLSGSTNVAYLWENRVAIWNGWAGPTGEVGPLYGKQLRAWQAGPDGQPIDQLGRTVDAIRAVKDDPSDPLARRLVLTTWNVADLPWMRLPPCHGIAVQFHVQDDTLSCSMYQRSLDCFIGAPFNIASYALLTHLLAQVCGMGVGELIHSIGDAHIYANHLEQVDEQLGRAPLSPPSLWLTPGLGDVDDFRRDLAAVVGYEHHPALRGEVAV